MSQHMFNEANFDEDSVRVRLADQLDALHVFMLIMAKRGEQAKMELEIHRKQHRNRSHYRAGFGR
jgi:hypothetical protein